MLFNSYPFLLVFLPIAILSVVFVQRAERRDLSIALMLVLSAIFYCYSSVQFFALLIASVSVNYALSIVVRSNRPVLTLGIVFNLALLGLFKYAGFFSTELRGLGVPVPLLQLGLPLAISFYTFKQISYLVDVYGGKVLRPGFPDYAAYVTFFPHLIAGPIVRYGEIAGRFARTVPFRVTGSGLRLGLIFIAFGLAKKVGLADRFAINAVAGFVALARHGMQGLDMLAGHAQFEDGSVSVEAGLMDMLDRMKTGRFKVLAHLNDWFEEFRLYHRKDGRVVKEGDDLMAATRYALMMLRHARTAAARDAFRGRIEMPNMAVA